MGFYPLFLIIYIQERVKQYLWHRLILKTIKAEPGVYDSALYLKDPPLSLSIAGALKVLAQFAPNTGIRPVFRNHKL